MFYTYCVREDALLNEVGNEYRVYGVSAINSNHEIIVSFPDIFFKKDQAERLVDICNKSDLSLIHLADVVKDALTEQYAVY